jgi:hypothetical protein
MTTGGMQSTIGKKTDLIGRIRGEMDKKIQNILWTFPASFTYSYFLGKL